MQLGEMKNAVLLLGIIAMIGAAIAIAVGGFQTSLEAGTDYACGVNGTEAFNITCRGQTGLLNTTGYLGTIGTIIGVSVLIGIVIMAFSFARR